MKKTYWLINVGLLFIIVFSAFYFYMTGKQKEVPTTADVPVPEDILTRYESTGDLPVERATSSESQTPVVNPRLTLPEDVWQKISTEWRSGGDEGNLVYDDGDGYSLNYSRRFDQFKSTIWREPAAQYRAEMEQKLISALGMPKEDICRLQMDVVRKTNLTVLNYQVIGLSFCPGSVPDEALLDTYVGD